MEDGFNSKSTRTSTQMTNGVTTKTVETTLTKPDGTKKVITEVTVTQRDGSQSTQTTEKTTRGSGSPSTNCSTMSTPSGGGDHKPVGPVDLKTFRDQALRSHNAKRAIHGVPALKMSADLNDYAQQWADHLVSTNSFSHSSCQLGDSRLGENIANKWSSAGADYTGEEATEQWYSEISKHNYSKDHQPGTGHFSQVVWRDSQEMGIGKARDNSGKVIVVGSYRPAGNLIGSWSSNVFPPK